MTGATSVGAGRGGERRGGVCGAGAGGEGGEDGSLSLVDRPRDELLFLTRARELTAGLLGPIDAPRLGGYRITGEAGVGAQGVVYRGVQESTSREVAIKVVHGGEGGWRSRREAEIVGGLNHPGIVTVHEARELGNGQTAIVMEYVRGVPIDQWWRRRSGDGSPRDELLGVFQGVCSAVHHAHLNGVIHRDLKPDNILVRHDASAVVLDFGVARQGEALQTRRGEVAGTPAYASPEQVSGAPESIDALTDVYSLGVVLYRLLAGRAPYELEGSLVEMASVVRETAPFPMRRVDPTIPEELSRIVARAMAKDKRDRYQSAASLGADLDRFRRGLAVEACGESSWYLTRKLLRRHRWKVVGGAAGFVLLLTAVAMIIQSRSAASRAERFALSQREQARIEAVRLRAVTELFRQVLPAADPENPEIGGAVAAGLGRLYFRLDSGAYADEPELDQEIRRLWGSVYTGIGTGKGTQFVEYAEVALRNGLVRMRESDSGASVEEISAAMHGLAGVLLVRGRLGEAERLATQTLEMREQSLGPTNPSVGESCALLAQIEMKLGATSDAVELADRAIEVLGEDPLGRDTTSSSMVALKAQAALDRLDALGAEPLVLEALRSRLRALAPHDPALLESLEQAGDLGSLCPDCGLARTLGEIWGGEGGSLLGAIRSDVRTLRGASVMMAPRVIDAGRTRAIARLLRLQASLLGPDDPAAIGMLMAQFQEAWVEGDLETRIGAATRAADLLSARFGETDLRVLMCIEQAAIAAAYAGRPERAVELGARGVAIWASYPEGVRDELLAANTRRRLAWYLDLAGRHEESAREYESALSALLSQLEPGHYLVALTQSGLAMSLAGVGDLERADRITQDSTRVLDKSTEIPPDTAAHIRFARGHVLVLRGRYEEARGYLVGAWEGAYSANSGTAFAWREMLIRDMVLVAEAHRDGPEADAWRARLPSPDPGP